MKISAFLTLLAGACTVAAVAVLDNKAPHVDLVARGPLPALDDPEFISQVLRAHNFHRKFHCAQPLTWDMGLAQAALNDIKKCPQNSAHDRAGSNLMSWGPVPDPLSDNWQEKSGTVTHQWYSEEKQYDYNHPGFTEATGHFTQVVWRATSRVGCAAWVCPATVNYPGRIYCYYEVPGNVIGQFPENVWPPVCS